MGLDSAPDLLRYLSGTYGEDTIERAPNRFRNLTDLGGEIYNCRINTSHQRNFRIVNQFFEKNEDLVAPILERCPGFNIILALLLEDRFGLRVHKIKSTTKMVDWSDRDCERVGMSFAAILRSKVTGEKAVHAWREQYKQVSDFALYLDMRA